MNKSARTQQRNGLVMIGILCMSASLTIISSIPVYAETTIPVGEVPSIKERIAPLEPEQRFNVEDNVLQLRLGGNLVEQ